MAHYAFLDENNVVTEVITGVDENVTQIDIDGSEVGGSTEAWEEFYKTRPWINAANCKRTSYNANFRKNFAYIGGIYDEVRDAFIGPKSYPSWILNEETCQWEAPTPMPTEGKWYWNEAEQVWVDANKL